MILEFPNHVSDKDIDTILSAVHPHVENGQTHVYNRDGKTVNITKTEELKEVDKLLQDIFADVHKSLVSQRYRPIRGSADQDYEYHRYDKGGELIFPAQNKAIKTEKGKIVVFPPYATHGHYTTPSPEVREVVVTWFVYSDIIVGINK
jgi:hypothetical protein